MECGLGRHIGLPDDPDIEKLKSVWSLGSQGIEIAGFGLITLDSLHANLGEYQNPIPYFYSNTSFLNFLDCGVTTTVQPPTLLATMLRTTQEMMTLHGRLKLSGYERDMALFVINHRHDADNKGTYKLYLMSVIINHCNLESTLNTIVN